MIRTRIPAMRPASRTSSFATQALKRPGRLSIITTSITAALGDGAGMRITRSMWLTLAPARA